MNSRQQALLQLVIDHRRISVADLAEALQVSVVTIRQDLNLLESNNYLKRVHGFAVALDSEDLDTRLMSNFRLKTQLARRAAGMIDEDETVFIEGGSSNVLLARELAKRNNITVITTSNYIAHLLKQSECEVILLGGIFQKKSESMVGPLTRRCLELVHFNKAFIGIDGFHPDTGFTNRDMMRADVANAALAKGACNIVLTDSSKFGLIHPNTLGVDATISMVITDKNIPETFAKEITSRGIQLDLVSEDEPEAG